jgi:hypothetical protein
MARFRMSHNPRRRVILPILLSLLASARGGTAPLPETCSRAETRIELVYRAIQPGEALLAKLYSDRPLLEAGLHFAGKAYDFRVTGHGGPALACLGLDLAMEPGDYPLESLVKFADGGRDALHLEIRVLPKSFPVKRLSVDEKYVTPPARVLDRIRAEADLLRSLYSVSTPEWLAVGAFTFPADGAAAANFGERRIFNEQPRSPHSGIDISSPQGAPVRASNGGRVVLARELYFSGNTVIIDHGLGVYSVYAHLSRISVQEGDAVTKGERIGEVGATGRVTGPHLHWSVRIRGNRVDPLSLLSLDFEAPDPRSASIGMPVQD